MMPAVTHRRATVADLAAVMQVIRQARAELGRAGVPQWQGAFPAEGDILADIQHRCAFVLLCQARVVGFVCLSLHPDPPYEVPGVREAFRFGGPYGTIHRTALADEARGLGLSHLLFSLCEEECRRVGMAAIRIDTHEKNARMRHIVMREGYALAAECTVHDGTKRLVYEKPL